MNLEQLIEMFRLGATQPRMVLSQTTAAEVAESLQRLAIERADTMREIATHRLIEVSHS